jgi:hypothetical protein
MLGLVPVNKTESEGYIHIQCYTLQSQIQYLCLCNVNNKANAVTEMSLVKGKVFPVLN